MNNNTFSFYSMAFLALALMGLIIVTQLFTNKATIALKDGNLQAVETIKTNNRMQQLVNLSFELQSKLSNNNAIIDEKRIGNLSDSVTMLGFNTKVLINAIKNLGLSQYSKTVGDIVNAQVNHLLYILVAVRSKNVAKRQALTDSLKTAQYGDKIYTSCLEVQKMLENNLQKALITNTEQAGKLSTYNRLLAVFSIVAIVIMATIIIKRQSLQLNLIEELKEAEAAALKSKNAKDDFLANMSHELRTPLNALIGFSNLLEQSELNSQQKEYVKVIRTGGYNLLNIVNDVLDLSKIEAGKLKIVRKPFSLTSIFENLEMMFSRAIAEKQLSYEWDIDNKIPVILNGDAERLKQILINLISNAIKFTSKGGIRLNAGVVWMDEDSSKFKLGFSIKDTGLGIPRDKIQTIFERFEQLENVTTRHHGGTGLGLTIVKNLVEKMGGAISVHSEIGEGSEFNFTCIFEKVENLSIEENRESINKQLSFEGYKLLAVEDNKANQTLLKHTLAKYNTLLSIAENGKEAIEKLKTTHFDLLLMDIQMPVMDGYTAIHIIRNQLKLNVPVVAMTAYVSESEIQKCKNAGFDDYLPKPMEEKTLLNTLSKYLQKKAATTGENENQADNLKFLKELVGDDPKAVHEIIIEMKAQWELDRSELESAVLNQNPIEIKRILHRLKSTFSPLGANHKIYEDIEGCNIASANGNKEADKSEYNNFISRVDSFVKNL